MIKITTNGRGYWSSAVRDVECLRMVLLESEYSKDFGELRVFFEPSSWSIEDLGLIYSDQGWETNLHKHLVSLGFTVQEAADCSYSEQGMQGGVGGNPDHYVSLDVAGSFIHAWKRLFQSESVAL